VEAHATVADLEQHQGIAEKRIEGIEQHVAQPPADDHPDHPPEKKIADLLRLEWRIIAPRPHPPQQPESAESDQVHQAVPVDGKAANLHGHRIELVVEEIGLVHGRGLSQVER